MGFSFSFFMIIFPSYSQQPNIVSSLSLRLHSQALNSFIVDGFSFSRF